MMRNWKDMRCLLTGSAGLQKGPTLRSLELMTQILKQYPQILSWSHWISTQKNNNPSNWTPYVRQEAHIAPTIQKRNSMLSGFTERESRMHSSADCWEFLKRTLLDGARTESTEKKGQEGKLVMLRWKKKLFNGSKNNILKASQLSEKISEIWQWNTQQSRNSSHPKDGSKTSWEDTASWSNMKVYDWFIKNMFFWIYVSHLI